MDVDSSMHMVWRITGIVNASWPISTLVVDYVQRKEPSGKFHVNWPESFLSSGFVDPGVLAWEASAISEWMLLVVPKKSQWCCLLKVPLNFIRKMTARNKFEAWGEPYPVLFFNKLLICGWIHAISWFEPFRHHPTHMGSQQKKFWPTSHQTQFPRIT